MQAEDTLDSFNAKLIKRNVKFTGFGKKENYGNLYRIALFSITESLYYENMPVVAAEDDTLADISMLLPYSMFRGISTNFKVDTMTLEFVIHDENKSRHIMIEKADGSLQQLFLDYQC